MKKSLKKPVKMACSQIVNVQLYSAEALSQIY